MKRLGYMAQEKISGALFKFEWGTGQYKGNFYIFDVNGKHLDIVERFDIIEIFHSVAE